MYNEQIYICIGDPSLSMLYCSSWNLELSPPVAIFSFRHQVFASDLIGVSNRLPASMHDAAGDVDNEIERDG